MVTQANPMPTSPRMHAGHTRPRHRRWWVIGTIIALSLGVYALGLTWAIDHVEAGVEGSIRVAPVVARANDANTPVADEGDGLK